MNWWKDLKGKVILNEPLKRHTTFKIGGPAKFFIEPKDINDLKLLLNLAKKYKITISVIGAGSNILVNDKGTKGIVLRLSAPCFKRIAFKKNCLVVYRKAYNHKKSPIEVIAEGDFLDAGSGAELNRVILTALNRGLSGLEFLVGIPATLGGAIIMNAGAHQKNIADLVENVTIMDYNGNIKILDKNRIKFGYRRSNLAKYIILSSCLKLFKKNKKQIKHRIEGYLSYRKRTQDLTKPSAGCVFRNPNQNSAGKLIDLCGLKGKRIGGAIVSEKHANFILNLGKASATDVLKLMNLVKRKVRQRFNIILKPELKIWQ